MNYNHVRGYGSGAYGRPVSRHGFLKELVGGLAAVGVLWALYWALGAL